MREGEGREGEGEGGREGEGEGARGGGKSVEGEREELGLVVLTRSDVDALSVKARQRIEEESLSTFSSVAMLKKTSLATEAGDRDEDKEDASEALTQGCRVEHGLPSDPVTGTKHICRVR